MTLEDIRNQSKQLSADQTITLLDAYITEHPDDDEAYLMRGLKNWATSRRAAAMSDYMTALRLNPQSRAGQAIRAANEILAYRNTDLINP